MDKNYVLQWSFRQKCWHIETVEDMLRTNLCAYAENRQLEYIPVAIGLTHDGASDLASRLESSGCQAGKSIIEKWASFRA